MKKKLHFAIDNDFFFDIISLVAKYNKNKTNEKEEKMINSAKIKGRIAEKGLTNQEIAPQIPCSAHTFGKKINNGTPMTLEEAIILSNILCITKEEFPEFFLN